MPTMALIYEYRDLVGDDGWPAHHRRRFQRARQSPRFRRERARRVRRRPRGDAVRSGRPLARHSPARDSRVRARSPRSPQGPLVNLWRAVCDGCDIDTFMHVTAEGPRRIQMRCPDCGHGQYVYAPGAGPKSVEPPNKKQFDLAAAQAYYDTGVSTRVCAEKFGVTESTLRRHGLVPRPRYCGQTPDSFYLAMPRKGARTTKRALELQAAGMLRKEIARELGITTEGVRRALERADRIPADLLLDK